MNFLNTPLDLTDKELERLWRYTKRASHIFNPDKNRLEYELKSDDSILTKVFQILDMEGHLQDRVCSPCVLLFSRAGCAQQKFHTDFPKSCKNSQNSQNNKNKKPLSVLFALDRQSTLETPLGQIVIPPFHGILFEGDFVHAGSAYEKDNIRLHLYLGVKNDRRVHNKRYLVE